MFFSGLAFLILTVLVLIVNGLGSQLKTALVSSSDNYIVFSTDKDSYAVSGDRFETISFRVQKPANASQNPRVGALSVQFAQLPSFLDTPEVTLGSDFAGATLVPSSAILNDRTFNVVLSTGSPKDITGTSEAFRITFKVRAGQTVAASSIQFKAEVADNVGGKHSMSSASAIQLTGSGGGGSPGITCISDNFASICVDKESYQVNSDGTEEIRVSLQKSPNSSATPALRGYTVTFKNLPGYLQPAKNNITVTSLLNGLTASGADQIQNGEYRVQATSGSAVTPSSVPTPLFSIRFRPIAGVTVTPTDINFLADLSDQQNTLHSLTGGKFRLTTGSSSGNGNSNAAANPVCISDNFARVCLDKESYRVNEDGTEEIKVSLDKPAGSSTTPSVRGYTFRFENLPAYLEPNKNAITLTSTYPGGALTATGSEQIGSGIYNVQATSGTALTPSSVPIGLFTIRFKPKAGQSVAETGIRFSVDISDGNNGLHALSGGNFRLVPGSGGGSGPFTVTAATEGAGCSVRPASQQISSGSTASIDVTIQSGFQLNAIKDNGTPLSNIQSNMSNVNGNTLTFTVSNIIENHSYIFVCAASSSNGNQNGSQNGNQNGVLNQNQNNGSGQNGNLNNNSGQNFNTNGGGGGQNQNGNGNNNGTLTGKVTCNNNPVSGARVSISKGVTLGPVTTGSDGNYIIEAIPSNVGYTVGVTNVASPCKDDPAVTTALTINRGSNTFNIALKTCNVKDECRPSQMCNGTTETTDWQCTNGQCTFTTTPNSDRCSDRICQNLQCATIPGTGQKQCSSDDSCFDAVCEAGTNVCKKVPGSGQRQCVSDDTCKLQLQNLYIVTNPFNDLMIGYQVTNNTVSFRAVSRLSSSNAVTWSLRGNAGGSLDRTAGESVTYTAGSISGQDVLTLSSGQNKAYALVTVRYSGSQPTFDITTTNLVQEQGTFPLNISLGADIGGTIPLKALAEYKDPATGQTKFVDVTSALSWSSSNADIGAVDSLGLFAAKKTGTTRISGTFNSLTSNAITIAVNPTFPEVNPAGYEPHFNPNPVARGYSTRFWVFVESDSGNRDDICVVSADLSQLNIAPVCTGSGSQIGDCNSQWRLQPAESEGRGRWYYLEFRVPFTVQNGTYPIRVQATSCADNKIDRRLTVPLRVVSEVNKCDVNGNGQFDILDPIFALQAAVGTKKQTDPFINIFADINGDGRIGVPEAICALRELTR